MSIFRVEMDVPNALRVEVSDDALTVELSHARTISAPLGWYPRLLHGRPEERDNWRLIGGGGGIRWEDLDEARANDAKHSAETALKHATDDMGMARAHAALALAIAQLKALDYLKKRVH